jgi:hypothetical protein
MSDAEAFYTHFKTRKAHILQLLESPSSSSKAVDEINTLNDQCKQQRKAISAHDIEYYLKEIDRLYAAANSSNNNNSTTESSKGDAQKKKTFKFSKGFRSKKSLPVKPFAAPSQQSPVGILLPDATTELTLSNKQEYTYTSDNSASADDKTYRKLVLTNIDNSTLVFSNHSFGTATLTSIKNCIIYLDAVPAGPVYLDRIVNSTIVIKRCQQCRIHDSVNSNVVLVCGSGRPIIEHCSGMRFGRFSKIFASLSAASEGSNDWVDVDDFNWLVKDQHSENWKELNDTESTRIASQVTALLH